MSLFIWKACFFPFHSTWKLNLSIPLLSIVNLNVILLFAILNCYIYPSFFQHFIMNFIIALCYCTDREYYNFMCASVLTIEECCWWSHKANSCFVILIISCIISHSVLSLLSIFLFNTTITCTKHLILILLCSVCCIIPPVMCWWINMLHEKGTLWSVYMYVTWMEFNKVMNDYDLFSTGNWFPRFCECQIWLRRGDSWRTRNCSIQQKRALARHSVWRS